MILVNGKLIESNKTDQVLKHLENNIKRTLSKKPLSTEKVLTACDKFIKNIKINDYIKFLEGIDIPEKLLISELKKLRIMFTKEYLSKRVKKELDGNMFDKKTFKPFGHNKKVSEMTVPLGVLLHIAAGNMEGLPIMTVIEGLLTW